MKRGYCPIDPGLVTFSSLSYDAQVRVLSHLIKRIPELHPVPEGVRFTLIPLSWIGDGRYPAIGLYTDSRALDDGYLTDLAIAIGLRLERFIEDTGVRGLRELANHETCTWRELLEEFGIEHTGEGSDAQ